MAQREVLKQTSLAKRVIKNEDVLREKCIAIKDEVMANVQSLYPKDVKQQLSKILFVERVDASVRDHKRRLQEENEETAKKRKESDDAL